MAHKKWETVMLSGENKSALQALKGKASYDALIEAMLSYFQETGINPLDTNSQRQGNGENINTNLRQLIKDYLQPIKDAVIATEPSSSITPQENVEDTQTYKKIISENILLQQQLESAGKQLKTIHFLYSELQEKVAKGEKSYKPGISKNADPEFKEFLERCRRLGIKM